MKGEIYKAFEIITDIVEPRLRQIMLHNANKITREMCKYRYCVLLVSMRDLFVIILSYVHAYCTPRVPNLAANLTIKNTKFLL